MDNPNFPYCNNCHNRFITPYHYYNHLSTCNGLRSSNDPLNIFSPTGKTPSFFSNSSKKKSSKK